VAALPAFAGTGRSPSASSCLDVGDAPCRSNRARAAAVRARVPEPRCTSSVTNLMALLLVAFRNRNRGKAAPKIGRVTHPADPADAGPDNR
jgi:hypothetical protein